MTRRLLLIITLPLAFVGSAGCSTLGKLGQVIMDPSIPVGAPGDQPTEVAFSINVSPTVNGNPNSLEAPLVADVAFESSSYAVNLNADDPYVLTEKVTSVLSHLQDRFPALSPEVSERDTAEEQLHSIQGEDTPGSYHRPGVPLDLPSVQTEASEQIATPITIKILQLRDDSLLRNSLYQALRTDPAKALRSSYIRDDDYVLLPGQFKFVPFAAVNPDTRYIAVIADYGPQQGTTWKQVLRIPPQGRHIVLSLLVQDSQLVLKGESQ